MNAPRHPSLPPASPPAPGDAVPQRPSQWTLSSQAPAESLANQGFVHLNAESLRGLVGISAQTEESWLPRWDHLPRDQHLLDGGNYRFRRHSCFIQTLDDDRLALSPHRAHWQSTDYNALHGGIDRLFEPIEPALLAEPGWAALLGGLGRLFGSVSGQRQWFIEAHQFRIDTRDGLGRPTPEGAHRDGVDFVAVVLVGRQGIKGGETRLFEARGPLGIRFVMEEPWSAVLLDDQRMVHEATPIQPVDAAREGRRDTLVLTYRTGGFQQAGA